jgi:hypothetical protein
LFLLRVKKSNEIIGDKIFDDFGFCFGTKKFKISQGKLPISEQERFLKDSYIEINDGFEKQK